MSACCGGDGRGDNDCSEAKQEVEELRDFVLRSIKFLEDDLGGTNVDEGPA